MKTGTKGLLLVLLAGFFSCEKRFDEHYNSAPETIDMRIWDAISANPDYSKFVELISEYELDSIFNQESSFTLFVPTNAAFESFNPDTGDISALLKFHILSYVFNLVSVDKARSIQTSGGKFALVEFFDGMFRYSGSGITSSSPLYLDGRYYELGEIAYPKQNLYEYIAQNTLVLKHYIDEFDSVLLDLEKSTPLGFDDEGNTVYDSVYTIANYFDTLYYPLNEEHRTRTATFILFDDDQYVNALDEMALDMGGGMVSGEDVPASWQEEVLLPELISLGLFPNSLQYEDFLPIKVRNILGDTVEVDPGLIDPERILCSNGVVFSYNDEFRVPQYLYKGEVSIEGEHMVDSVAAGIFFWKPEFKVSGSTSAVAATPVKGYVPEGARNDSTVSVTFPFSFEGEFTFEFYFKNMFPQRYQFVWAASSRPSGLYQVFVNDVFIREFDTFSLRSAVPSIVTGEYFFPINGHNKFDGLVDHLTEYGDVKITLKYISSGFLKDDGFNIDYISLIPVDVE